MSKIHNKKIAAIIKESAEELIQLVGDYQDELERVMTELDEGEKLKITHSITIDLEKDKLTNNVSFSQKIGGSSEQQLPDPDQSEMQTVVEEAKKGGKKPKSKKKSSGIHPEQSR